MRKVIPNAEWYKSKSADGNVASACPYANAHKCPRYYSSLYLLGKTKVTTSIAEDKIKALDEFWEKSEILPIIAEDDSSIFGSDGKKSYINFCPEIAFSYLGYYANNLISYADEIDQDIGQRIAEKENLDNNWRHYWSSVSACHYLECTAFNQTEIFNKKNATTLEKLAHQNIIKLIERMELCLENSDPTGTLHAAANILETMAKDLLGVPSIQNQTLGSFISKYENESKLPPILKSVAKEIYNLRNSTPLSGHGSIAQPDITLHDAIIISASTKFIVEVEYRLKKT